MLIVPAAVSFTPWVFVTARTVVLFAIAVNPIPRIVAAVAPLPETLPVEISNWLLLRPVLETVYVTPFRGERASVGEAYTSTG
jgi:hypothetical protein